MNTIAVGNYNDHEHALHLTGRIGNKPSEQFHIAIDAPKETAAILAPLVASGVRWNAVELWRALEALVRENERLRDALKDAIMWVSDDDQGAAEYKTKWRALCS